MKIKFFILFFFICIKAYSIQVNVTPQSFCEDYAIVDVDITESNPTDFHTDDNNTQFLTLGLSDYTNFEFVTYGYTVNVTISGGGGGPGSTGSYQPFICTNNDATCANDDVTTQLFNISYLFKTGGNSNAIDVIHIRGLRIHNKTSSSAGTTVNIIRVNNTVMPPYTATQKDADITGSAEGDNKALATLIVPPDKVSFTLSPNAICIGNNKIDFTVTPVPGAARYRLIECNSTAANNCVDWGIVTLDNNNKFSISILSTTTDSRYFKVIADIQIDQSSTHTPKDALCTIEADVQKITVANTSFLSISASNNDNYCIGDNTPIEFTLGSTISGSKYYIYKDQGGVIPDVNLGEIKKNSSGNLEYTPPSSITTQQDITYFIVMDPPTGCSQSTNNKTIHYQQKPTISSSYTVDPVVVISTNGVVQLSNLVTTSSNTKVVGVSTPGYIPSASSALSNSQQFDPSSLSSGTYQVDVYAENLTTGCRSNTISIKIKVVDGNNTLPYFLRNLDPMPICENMPGNKFRLFALISSNCISPNVNIPLKVYVEDISVPKGTAYTVDATYTPGDNAYLGGVTYYGYEFDINPSLHRDYAIKVRFDITAPFCSYEGQIPINPRRDPKLTGLPELSTTDIDHYLCSSSNDSIFMRGNPVGGSYNFYKGILKAGTTNEYVYSYLGTTLSPNPPPPNDKSLERFTPSHLFYDKLDRNLTSIVKVVYTVPANSSGSCPDSITKFLHFNPSVDVKMHVKDQLCYGTPILFNVNYAIGIKNIRTTSDKFYWNFDDGFSINYDTLIYQEHDYKAPGAYDIRFITKLINLPPNTCNFDTIQSIRVGAMPVVDFEVRNNFIDSLTYFKSNAMIKVASIPNKEEDVLHKWEYKIESSNFTHYLNPTQGDTSYLFPTDILKEPYKLTHIVTATYGCKDSAIYYVPIFPINNPNKLKASIDSFDVDDKNGWFESGQYQIKDTKSSWINGTPKGKTIKDSIGIQDAWLTLNSTDTTAFYNANERSWVESPVYNLNQLDLPMVSLSNFVNSELNSDGVSLQYAFCDTSAFGHEVWNTIGDEKTGLNWYKSKLIYGLKDDQFKGWSGIEQKNWQFSAYGLSQIKKAIKNKQSLVRFRLIFGSNGNNDADYGKFEGFAFDNFFVGERNRKVLIEEFCDFKRFDKGDLTKDKLPYDTLQGYYIQYHSGTWTNNDDIFNARPDEPSARALHYGIGKFLPRGVIDGIIYDNKDSLGLWGPKAYDNRSLIVSPINMTVTADLDVDSILIHTEVVNNDIKLEDRNLLLHVAVVEKAVIGNGATFANVLRGMVPNAAGTRIDKSLSLDGTLKFDCKWKPFTKPNSDFNIIAYIQDEDSKEIYQASKVIVKQWMATEALNHKKSGEISETNISFNEMSIQPNPIAEDLRVVFNGILNSNYDYLISDSYGRIISTGTLNSGINAAFIETQGLKPGIYNLMVKGEGRAMMQKFAVVR